MLVQFLMGVSGRIMSLMPNLGSLCLSLSANRSRTLESLIVDGVTTHHKENALACMLDFSKLSYKGRDQLAAAFAALRSQASSPLNNILFVL